MKKFLLLFFSISLCTLFASAQITKGSVLLGGGLSFGTNKSEPPNGAETKQTNYGIGLSAGVAVKENTIVGGSLNYTYSIQKNETFNGTITQFESSSYGAGVFYAGMYH